MPNYQNGKIYAIRSNQTDDVYIGSTTVSLASRMGQHVYDHKVGKTISSTMILNYDDAYIELIENCPCSSKEELLKKEGEHIRNTLNCINRHIAGRTSQEYYQDNRDDLLRGKKMYYEENKDKLSKYHKEWSKGKESELKDYMHNYYDKNKESLLAKNKQYRDNNKEKIKETDRLKYQRNKEKIRARCSEVVQCECGLKSTYGKISTHKKCKHHIRFIETNGNLAIINPTKNYHCYECGVSLTTKQNYITHNNSKEHKMVYDYFFTQCFE